MRNSLKWSKYILYYETATNFWVPVSESCESHMKCTSQSCMLNNSFTVYGATLEGCVELEKVAYEVMTFYVISSSNSLFSPCQEVMSHPASGFYHHGLLPKYMKPDNISLNPIKPRTLIRLSFLRLLCHIMFTDIQTFLEFSPKYEKITL